MIEREEISPVSVRPQCELLNLKRASFYYEPVPGSPEDQAVMNLIDEIYTKWAFYGARRMSQELKALGSFVGRKPAGRLMRLMGLEAIFPKRNTSRPHPGHPVYPYLLPGINITRTNHVWSMDITSIRLRQGFVYLAAVMDWESRYVLS